MINCRMSETRWKRLNLAANLKTYNTADKSSIKRAICNTTTTYARLRTYVRSHQSHLTQHKPHICRHTVRQTAKQKSQGGRRGAKCVVASGTNVYQHTEWSRKKTEQSLMHCHFAYEAYSTHWNTQRRSRSTVNSFIHQQHGKQHGRCDLVLAQQAQYWHCCTAILCK